MLTVREMLMYTAELKRDKNETRKVKEEVVEEWIEKLALTSCVDTQIGSALSRGISGGQAKRVNIGIALVSDPRVLFLDEPTSGLDSFTANEVMTYVQRLTKDGVTICATIHSPSQYCFSLFDRAIMLVRGEVVYFGPNNKSAIDFFKDYNPDTQLIEAENSNDAEWLTDVIVSSDRRGKGHDLADFYSKSVIKQQADYDLGALTKQTSNINDTVMKQLQVTHATTVPTLKALRTLFQFRTLKNYRSADYLGPRLGDKIITSFIILTLYLNVGDDYRSRTDLRIPYNVLAVLFMWCTLPAFGAAAYVPAIVLERATFVRERNDGLYRTITYLLYKIVEELLVSTLLSVVISAAVFYAVGLGGSFVSFWLIYWITLNTGIVLAYFVAALSPNMDVANAALPAYVVTLLFFAGLLIAQPDMPEYWEWYSYIDFLRYSWMGLVRNQFDEDLDNDQEAEEGIVSSQKVAELVFDLYKVDFMGKWAMFGINLAIYFFFFCCAWAALQFKNHV